MSKVLIAALLLLSAPAQAKAWKGVTPGTSKKDDVVRKFGDPTKRVTQGDNTLLAYAEDEAIKGTRETEFTIDPSGTVTQIAVFPAGPVDKATIEESYGPDCAKQLRSDCYIRKLSEDDYRTYYWYKQVGLVVFFNTDGATVQSFLYVAPNASGSATSASKGDAPKPKKKVKAADDDAASP